jgi:glutathione S-transferase
VHQKLNEKTVVGDKVCVADLSSYILFWIDASTVVKFGFVDELDLLQEAVYDAELQAGLEAQKRLREQILRRKEMRRQMQAAQRRQEMQTSQGNDV